MANLPTSEIANLHPLAIDDINDAPTQLDLHIWCGATFVHSMVFQHKMVSANGDIFFPDSREYTNYVDRLVKDHEVVYSYGQDPCHESVSFGFDKLVLNIRPKSASRCKLNPPTWSFEFTPGLHVPDDRPLPMMDQIITRINIPADVTEQMLATAYDYELVAITNSALCVVFTAPRQGECLYPEEVVYADNPVEFDEEESFSFKQVVLFGDMYTHQPGAI